MDCKVFSKNAADVAKRLGFPLRQNQMTYMEAVAECLHAPNDANEFVSLLEMEAGAGKTVGYLIPVIGYAMLENVRCLIAIRDSGERSRMLSKDFVTARAIAEATLQRHGTCRKPDVAVFSDARAWVCARTAQVALADARACERRFFLDLVSWIDSPESSGLTDDWLDGRPLPDGWIPEDLSLFGEENARYLAQAESAARADVVLTDHGTLCRWLLGQTRLPGDKPFGAVIIDDGHLFEARFANALSRRVSLKRLWCDFKRIFGDRIPAPVARLLAGDVSWDVVRQTAIVLEGMDLPLARARRDLFRSFLVDENRLRHRNGVIESTVCMRVPARHRFRESGATILITSSTLDGVAEDLGVSTVTRFRRRIVGSRHVWATAMHPLVERERLLEAVSDMCRLAIAEAGPCGLVLTESFEAAARLASLLPKDGFLGHLPGQTLSSLAESAFKARRTLITPEGWRLTAPFDFVLITRLPEPEPGCCHACVTHCDDAARRTRQRALRRLVHGLGRAFHNQEKPPSLFVADPSFIESALWQRVPVSFRTRPRLFVGRADEACLRRIRPAGGEAVTVEAVT